MLSPFIRNLDAFTTALGVENAPAVITFAKVPWKDDEQRDEFIRDLTGFDRTEFNNYGA